MKKIGNSAFLLSFWDQDPPASITIPESVTSIGDNAFSYCVGMISITLPKSLVTIGKEAFMESNALSTVIIPNSVTSIGEGAFYNCAMLESVTILESLNSVGNNAFNGCGFSSVTILAKTPPEIPNLSFFDTTIDTLGKVIIQQRIDIHVPKGCKDAYQNHKKWKFYNIIDDVDLNY